MEEEVFEEILYRLSTFKINEVEVEYFDLEQETLDDVAQWASNCFYGKIVLDREVHSVL